jgi:hypothetical protein
MAFKELEWREGLTDAVKVHNERETDAATRLRVHGAVGVAASCFGAWASGPALRAAARHRGRPCGG